MFSTDVVAGQRPQASESKFTHAAVFVWCPGTSANPSSQLHTLEFVGNPQCGKTGIVKIDSLENLIEREDGLFSYDAPKGFMLGNLSSEAGSSGQFAMTFDELKQEALKWNGKVFLTSRLANTPIAYVFVRPYSRILPVT